MRIAISNIIDKFKLKFKRLFYAYGPEVTVNTISTCGHENVLALVTTRNGNFA